MEHKSTSFLKNFSVLTLSNIIVNILGLFINIYLARTLKPVHYGDYGVIITTMSIFYTISSLGLQQIVIRSIARNQNNSKFYLHISIIARIIGLITSTVILVFYSTYINKEYSFLVLILMVLYMITMSGWDAFQNVAFGMQRMEFTGYINVVASGLILSAYLLLPVKYLDLDLILIVIVTVQVVKLVFYYFNLKKYKFFTGNFCEKNQLKSNVNNLIKESFPYFILSVFTLFTTQLPVLFLDYYSGPQEVAFFNTANKLLVPLTLMISAAMSALFPELSKHFILDKKVFQNKVRISFQFLIYLGVFCAVIVTFFRNEVVVLLYGNEYSATGLIMAYQCWYVVLFSIFWFFGSVFGAMDKQNLLAKLSIVYSLISVPILWYFSKFGAESVSKGYIIISVINMTYHYYYFQKSLPERFSILETVKDFGLLIVAFTVCMLMPSDIAIYIRILFSIFLFVVLFMVLKQKYIKSKVIS